MNRLLLFTLLAALLVAAPASASSTSVGGGILYVTADDGEVNDLLVTYTGTSGAYLVAERGPLLTLRRGAQCADNGGGVARCTGVSEIRVDAGDGGDKVAIGATVTLKATLTDGAGNDTVTGGGGNDVFVGSPGDDTLDGGAGNDAFGDAGGLGADTLIGGAGSDTANYSGRASGVIVSADDTAGDGVTAENDDVRSDVEVLIGGAAADRLTGGPGNDTLRGGNGDDVLDGRGGSDVLEGGGGEDTADYRTRTVGLKLSGDGVANDGAAGEADNVGADVEKLIAGSGNDELTGRSSADVLAGGDGNDTLRGLDGDDVLDGGPGADVLDGNAGTDTVDYSSRTYPLDVDLAAGRGTDGDTLTGIDGVLGGSADDRLRGNDSGGRFDGGPGNDWLDGRGGADRLSGGAGWDHVDYTARREDVFVSMNDGADDGESGERDDVRRDVESVATGAGDDKLTGDDDANSLNAGSGDDEVRGNGGDDALNGGSGRDTVDGGTGNDDLAGGDGDDKVYGGAGDDTLAAGTGNDRANGDDGNDTIDLGAGTDESDGGRGSDRIAGGDGNDKLYGSDDADDLDGGSGNDSVEGGAGDDVVRGGTGDDKPSGGDGNDIVDGGDNNDTVNGGAGNDGLDGGAGNDTVSGSIGDDVVSGSAGDDKVSGDDGADQVDGGSGRDRVSGGNGADTVLGGTEDDTVNGDGGDDRLDGGDGNDEVSGGGEDDVVIGGAGADKLRGDSGEDTVDYGMRTAALKLSNDGRSDDGEQGEGDNIDGSIDHAIGGAGDDVIKFASDWPHRLYGEGGDDTLDGGGKNDLMLGGPGNDQLIGRKGVDRMDGGAGNDRLSGADGTREELRCGVGRDTAVKDSIDKAVACESTSVGQADDDGAIATEPVRPVGTRRSTAKAKLVPVPGAPAHRVDRRVLGDIAYLQAAYNVTVAGSQNRGLAVDVVPGEGGSWADVDKLAGWVEPQQNRPRRPFHAVGYTGDAGLGRGQKLRLTWRHAKSRRWVEIFSFARRNTVKVGNLTALARKSNRRLGTAPAVKTGLRELDRCKGGKQLTGTFKKAGKAFKVDWKILSAVTAVTSGYGCNMGPTPTGRLGWTHVDEASWKLWGMDADGNGKATPYSSADAAFSLARRLRAAGAPKRYTKALKALGLDATAILKRRKTL